MEIRFADWAGRPELFWANRIRHSMRRKDYYGILGLARDADEGEVKAAYRKLALRNHPDTNRDDPQAEDRFKEINEAYEVLINKDKRSQYDLGRDPLAGSPFRPSAPDPWTDPFEAGCFSGSQCKGGGFARLFGRKGRARHFSPHRSDSQIHDLLLTPDEAFNGTERDIRLHMVRDTQVFTVPIPAGVENGTLLSFKRAVGDGQDVEFLFRVRIAV